MGILLEQLISDGYLKTSQIIESFKKIKRADFVSRDLLKEKGEDFIENYNAPLSIGYSQTISQPLTVAFMLELLQPKKGDKILDIGSGSGWQTALLAEIVGAEGKVFAIEIIPELKQFGENNVSKYNFISKSRVEFFCGDGSRGLASEAPFDKIIAAASVDKLPESWKDQLKINGRLVSPVGNDVFLFIRKKKDVFEKYKYSGFSFVPLVKKYNV